MSPAKKTKKSIKDEYDIISDLGQGGMAQVYKALQLSLNRTVAIKEIKPAFSAHPELVERFRREARAAAGLIHENIVQVYNFGEPKRGDLFIVMEFVEGQDLKSLISKTKPMDPKIAAVIGREVARALAYAHARGLVHRDVKPGNVMISKLGEVKLMDFGIVREMGSDLTQTGAFLGTPNYMSPEQFLGENTSGASDIFSLGIVLYQMLTSQKPFAADSESSLSKSVRTEKEPKVRALNPEVPRKLQKIVHKCLKKKPEARIGSAEELARELDKFIRSKSRVEDRRQLAAFANLSSEGDRTVTIGSVQPAADAKPKTAKIIKAKTISPSEEAPPTRVSTTKAGPKTKASKTAAQETREVVIEKRPVKKEEPEKPAPDKISEEETSDAGEFITKWLLRLIMLAIVLLAAVIAFLFLDFPGDSGSGEEAGAVRKALDYIMSLIDGSTASNYSDIINQIKSLIP
jgi:eukaryotic-like serine/threonine-protein kinase